MENVVSFETANSMMTAGFPQPTEYFAGQHWWYVRWQGGRVQSPVECIINMSSRYNRLMAEPVDGVDGDLTAPVFAPTATDILRELPNKILFWKYENIFVCGVQVVGDNDYYTIQFETVYKHENPAEACALAWLELKKK